MPGISVELANEGHFSYFGKRLIEQKIGAEMFPTPTFNVTNFDPNTIYRISLRFDRLDDCKLTPQKQKGAVKWVKSKAEPAGAEQQQVVIHTGDRPGSWWMSDGPCNLWFSMRIVAEPESDSEDSLQIVLQDRCRYRPVLTVREVTKHGGITLVGISHDFSFPDTDFIVVDKYTSRKMRDVRNALWSMEHDEPQPPPPSLKSHTNRRKRKCSASSRPKAKRSWRSLPRSSASTEASTSPEDVATSEEPPILQIIVAPEEVGNGTVTLEEVFEEPIYYFRM